MKNQLALTSLSWAHLLNYANFNSQLITPEHEILSIPYLNLKKLYKEITATQIIHCKYVPKILRFFKLHINSLKNTYLSESSFSHTHHHFVPIV
jgi:hypothetical protein